MRLDRLVRKWASCGGREARELIGSGVVSVNGEIFTKADSLIGPFDLIRCRGKTVQNRTRRAIMLNKPSGVVSATWDEEHRTVVDLVEESWAEELHLAGRLDRFTTGLVVLTNDSNFSESLTEPGRKVGKRYLVGLDGILTESIVESLRKGLWFQKEKVTTAPAVVDVLSAMACRLTIFEGKHHQVKRMFARHDLKVRSLHREAIGEIELPTDLEPGRWRDLL